MPNTTHCASVAYQDASVNAVEDEILSRVNGYRASGRSCGSRGNFGKTHALKMNAKLRCAARKHSADMQKRNYFSHTTPAGTTFSKRISNAGYAWSSVGENILWSGGAPPSAKTMVDAWIKSDGHCANIMSSKFTEIGVGISNQPSAAKHYATQDFGKPQ
ncbi:MAG: CAP domain-containing protein [Myxococcales bacterium]|nr:CAP domain-containing protein [Myxococcales bacterium]